jgi:CBS domain-containing membrane protein
MKIHELMSTDLVTLTEDETLAHAKRCMERGRLRHLPVLRGRSLVGLVTHRDLLAASFSVLAEVDSQEQRRVFMQVLVSEIMHRDLKTVDRDTPSQRRPRSCCATSSAACQWWVRTWSCSGS